MRKILFLLLALFLCSALFAEDVQNAADNPSLNNSSNVAPDPNLNTENTGVPVDPSKERIVPSAMTPSTCPECFSQDQYGSGCRTIVLDPKQVQTLWDNYLAKGLRPDTLYSGSPRTPGQNVQRVGSAEAQEGVNPTLNVVDPASGQGTQVALPREGQAPRSGDFMLEQSCTGDFSYGLLINDTMRVGRCLGDVNNCALRTSGLKYRNSSDWIDVIKQSVSDLNPLHQKYTATNQEATGEPLQETVEPEEKIIDLNDMNEIDPNTNNLQGIQTVRRPADVIPNSTETDAYWGEFQSVCGGETASERCQVLLLSYFDKYYNAYYSGTILTALAAPAVMGISRKTLSALNESKAGNYVLSGSKKRLADIKAAMDKTSGKIFAKDIKTLGDDLAAQKAGMDSAGLGSFRKSFDEFAHEGPAKATGNLDAMAADITKFPGKAKPARKWLTSQVKYSESTLSAASASGDDLAKAAVFRDAAENANAMGLKLEKNFFAEADYAKYNNYYVLKDGKHVPAPKDWKAFVAGEHGQAFRKVPANIAPSGLPNVPHAGLTDTFVRGLPAGDEFYVKIGTENWQLTTQNLAEIRAKLPPSVDIPIWRGTGETYTPIADYANTAVAKDWVKFAEKRVTNIRDTARSWETGMLERGLLPKNYPNALNAWVYSDKLRWNKYIPGRALGGFGGSYLYWQAKTNKESPFKSYFIGKDEYTNVKFSTGIGPVYNDAYFDLFANNEVNNGDLFGQAIARMASLFEFIGLEKTEETLGIISRNDVQDVLLYTSTNENCPSCWSSYKVTGKNASVHTRTYLDSRNFAIELPDNETYQLDGSSLAIFAHHTDLDLQTKQIQKKIDIQQGIGTQDTCIDRAKNVALLNNFDYFKNSPSRIGLPIGIIDSTSFMMYGMIVPGGMSVMALGILTSMLLAEEMNETFGDCVDSEDGYYVQYIYHPPEKKDDKSGILDSLRSVVSEGESTVENKNQLGNKFEEAVSSVKDKIIQTVEGADKEFMQIYFETKGKGDTQLDSDSIFLTWLAGGAYCSPNKVDLNGKITMQDGANTIEIDKENEEIRINGQTILRSPLVRTIVPNLRIGAMEMAHSATFVPATGDYDFFELTSNGGLRVLSPDAYECIARGLEIQTGRSLTSDSLTSILGIVTQASTAQGTNVVTDGQYFTVAGGTVGRENIAGRSIIVNREVQMTTSTTQGLLNLGTMDSILTEKGMILYDPQHKEFIVWARILAEMLGSQISGFNASPTTVKNPITGCDEHAVDLSVVANQGDYSATQDAELMNQALQKAGPYQYFETPSKSFYFYSKLENGQCKPYMQIRDKATGKVLVDAPISSIQKTADGFSVTTEDGKTHEFGFSAENGRPILSYNGEKDLLLMAQGRNGSFYFDPKTGKWYVGNSQLLPIDDKFREEGMVNIGGTVTPGKNPLSAGLSKSGRQGSWDIPLFDESERWMLILGSLGIVSVLLMTNRKRRK